MHSKVFTAKINMTGESTIKKKKKKSHAYRIPTCQEDVSFCLERLISAEGQGCVFLLGQITCKSTVAAAQIDAGLLLRACEEEGRGRASWEK